MHPLVPEKTPSFILRRVMKTKGWMKKGAFPGNEKEAHSPTAG